MNTINGGNYIIHVYGRQFTPYFITTYCFLTNCRKQTENDSQTTTSFTEIVIPHQYEKREIKKQNRRGSNNSSLCLSTRLGIWSSTHGLFLDLIACKCACSFKRSIMALRACQTLSVVLGVFYLNLHMLSSGIHLWVWTFSDIHAYNCLSINRIYKDLERAETNYLSSVVRPG